MSVVVESVEVSNGAVKEERDEGTRIKDPVNECFSVIGKSGTFDMVKCNYCGWERIRLVRYLKKHLADDCDSAPIEVKDMCREEVSKSATPSVAGSLVTGDMDTESRTSATRTRKRPTRYGDDGGSDENIDEDDEDDDDDEDFDDEVVTPRRRGRPARGKSGRLSSATPVASAASAPRYTNNATPSAAASANVAAAQISATLEKQFQQMLNKLTQTASRIESNLQKTASSYEPPTKVKAVFKTKDELEREEHEMRMRKYEAEIKFLKIEATVYETVGESLAAFLRTADLFLQDIRAKNQTAVIDVSSLLPTGYLDTDHVD